MLRRAARSVLAAPTGGTSAVLGPLVRRVLPLALLALGALAAILTLTVAGIVAGGIAASASSCQGGGSAPASVNGVPDNLLPIYEQASSKYGLSANGWAYLASINAQETDFGQNLDVSSAGAIGWMQFEPSTWRKYGVSADPLKPGATPDPYDPWDAIFAAASYLRASGAPANWQGAIFAYNHAGWYVSQVTVRAQQYVAEGTGAAAGSSVLIPSDTCLEQQVSLAPGSQAKILSDGYAEAPADAPAAVQAMIAAGNRIDSFDYQWGGGHADPALSDSQTDPRPQGGTKPGDNGTPGYDCSGATDYALYGGGLGQSLLGGGDPASTALESVGEPGPGRWVTIFANAAHAYIEVPGIYMDTAAGIGKPPNPPSTGPRWTPVGTGPSGFVERHPAGM